MTESIGDRLKKLRNEHNFTQKQIGDYLGFEQTQISMLEQNQITLNSTSLNKLCILYNCDLEYILEGTGQYSSELKYESNNLDLNTIADMNRIIRNLKRLKELNESTIT